MSTRGVDKLTAGVYCQRMAATAGLPKIPEHFTLDQLRKMRENAYLAVGDARARRNRKTEMKYQQAITMIDSRIDELSYNLQKGQTA